MYAANTPKSARRERPDPRVLALWFKMGAPWELTRSPISWPNSHPSYHPQGLLKVGSYFYLSTVDKTGRFIRNNQNGYLYKFSLDETQSKIEISSSIRIKIPVLGSSEYEYHPGGLDFQERDNTIIVPIAQYRRKSTTSFLKINPDTLEHEILIKDNDHYGHVICAPNRLLSGDWHSHHLRHIKNGSNHELGTMKRSYQDCKFIHEQNLAAEDQIYALCGGLTRIPRLHWRKFSSLPIFFRDGYLDLVQINLQKHSPTHSIRVIGTKKVDVIDNLPLTHNTMEVEQINLHEKKAKLRFYFAPHDQFATRLFIYESPILSIESLDLSIF